MKVGAVFSSVTLAESRASATVPLPILLPSRLGMLPGASVPVTFPAATSAIFASVTAPSARRAVAKEPEVIFAASSAGTCPAARVPTRLATGSERFVSPAPLPVNTPTIWLFALVRMTTPAKLFVPVKTLVPLRKATFAESRASASVPAERLPALRLVRLAPEPLKPEAVTLPVKVGAVFSRATLAESCASASVPLMPDGTIPVNPAPLPLNVVAVMVPFTSSAVAGLFLPMPTPPPARIKSWLLAVVAKSASVESAQTKAPVCSALARRPAAKA